MRELDVIVSALREASAIVMGGDRSSEAKETVVGTYDVVTGSDVRAEELIITCIRESFPDDVIISEETNPDAEMGGRTWAIDPIDGTMNYTRGIPLFGMQAVFMEDGVPRASAIYLPVQDEMFTASSEGAFLNGVPIHVSEARPLKQCILSAGDFSRKSETFRKAQAVLLGECYDSIARFKVMGSACIDFAYLSCGRSDLHVRFVNRIWDFMPGLFLAETAGAVFDRKIFDEDRILIMCSSEGVLTEAMEKIYPKIAECFR